MALRVVGLMSGTSHDGIDAAVVDLEAHGDTLYVTVLGHLSEAYPPDLRAAIARTLPPAPATALDWCRLDTGIGQAFAAVARRAVEELGGGRADLVVSHGQTLFHWVEGGAVRGTLQVGQPAWVAEATGLPVVSDLRSRDVAAGGQGAPLVALFDVLWLRGRPGRPVALNLGGIANITAGVEGTFPVAYDTGPANALLDAAVVHLSAGTEAFDADGARAARGRVDEALLAELLADPYYARPAPKSTGKEWFNAAYLERVWRGHAHLGGDDVLATLSALTARTVADEARRHGATEVVASGGGVRNPTLWRDLARELGDVGLTRASDRGLADQAKEAVAFAVLGWLTWAGHPASLPSATGARGPRLLGSITPGDGPLRLPGSPGSGTAPTRLVLAGA
ncbi:anhydro-N-acetylmuramic acid kinase [Oryzihumus leptocrescens]|uniref:Anhydro-N-acetylmuramic acid kinase n=1 Tax=Oryzihumus leptocrescens TaxID=297536 RepID=A0A542ZHT0_9MICO|nr:anhydro-N-acetylmuramic acid kinase [Oryzihumus leptocrescens]